MKSLAVAVGILVVIIVATFIFTKGDGSGNDTFIPSPSPISSPGFDFISQATNKPVTQDAPFPILAKEEIKGKKGRIKTTKGDIVFELFSDAVITSSSFIHLASKKFYDGLIFHRREEGFVIQGGDPNGNGTGGPGYKFQDEAVTQEYNRGIVAMANSGPSTNGSQFFIMLADAPTLPKNYTIFGNVVEGLDVVDQIKIGDKMTSVSIE